MSITLHRGDLPAGLDLGPVVAIDTETMGLRVGHDRLCLVQLSAGDGTAHLVQIAKGQKTAPNLVRLLTDPKVTKLFHFARFDLAALGDHFGITVGPVWCTKIASKLVRTFTDRHGLKELTRDLVGIEMNKQQQSSDWGAAELGPEQLAYAASDVLHLHAIKARLTEMLVREGRMELAEACFAFLPTRAAIDRLGFGEDDIFAH